MANAADTGLPASYLNVYSGWELGALALAGLVIAVVGALLPASWAAGTRTAPPCTPSEPSAARQVSPAGDAG